MARSMRQAGINVLILSLSKDADLMLRQARNSDPMLRQAQHEGSHFFTLPIEGEGGVGVT